MLVKDAPNLIVAYQLLNKYLQKMLLARDGFSALLDFIFQSFHLSLMLFPGN